MVGFNENDMESEVNDLRHVAAPSKSGCHPVKSRVVGGSIPPSLDGEGADDTSHTTTGGNVADGGKPDNVGRDVSQPIIDEEDVCWAPEMEWLLSLMPDKGLVVLRDVVKYRVDGEEYFRNPGCTISGGTMNYIIQVIDGEMKWRRENAVCIEY